MIDQSEAAQNSRPQDGFVARQPVFGKDGLVEGYLLIFGASETVAAGGDSSKEDHAFSLPTVIEKLAGAKRAYAQFSPGLLHGDVLTELRSNQVVVQIPCAELLSPETVEACQLLKAQGIHLALEGFDFQPEFDQMLDLASIATVDFRRADVVERARVAQSLIPRGLVCLASGLETHADRVEAEQLGYTLFQGSFFSRPSGRAARSLSSSSYVCLEAFREVCKPEIDFDRVAEVVKRDVSFSYKLLRFVNSAALGLRTRIHSIKQALVILGRKESARWLSLVALRDFGSEKPDELVITCIVRARMGELLAPLLGMKERSSDIFLLGVFSAIDAFMDRPVEDVVADLPLAPDVQMALLGEDNELRGVLDLILAYERCSWSEVGEYVSAHNLTEGAVPDAYVAAVGWANEFFPDLQGE